MRKTTKKMLISVIGASLIACSVPCAVHAESEEPVPTVYNVNVRIEGISECLYCESVSIFGAEYFTAADVLNYVDLQDDSITITGIEDSYITDVNGDSAGAFGGWDGWLYTVNGEEAAVGIGDYQISDGDSILLYFGDPYGAVMQFPIMNYDETSGMLTFTSLDTAYDENWNPVVSENPVSGMDVVIDDGTSFVTDENGQVDISALASGSYSISWSRYDENGLPTVLRSAPDVYLDLGFTLGDVTEDGIIDPVDATRILSIYSYDSMEESFGETELQRLAADTDSNGAIDPTDATNVLRFYSYASMGEASDLRDFIN